MRTTCTIIDKVAPNMRNALWLKPVDGGYSLYANLYGSGWKPLKLVDDKGTPWAGDDAVIPTDSLPGLLEQLSKLETDTEAAIADLQRQIDAIPAGGGGGAVDSVNGKTGEVVLEPSDLGMGSVLGDIETLQGGKVDKVSGKGLSSNDYTTEEKQKLAGLSNYDDSSIQAAVAGKVDKVSGKGLSANDYTNEDKAKLDSLTDQTATPTSKGYMSLQDKMKLDKVTINSTSVAISNMEGQYMRNTQEGFDVDKVSDHFKELIEQEFPLDVINVDPDGFYILDEQGYIGLKLTSAGLETKLVQNNN